MDHSDALVIECSPEMKTRHIRSQFDHNDKESTLARSEHVMHNKEQGQQHAYYHALGDIIRDYQQVVLFGPTDAKRELHNHLAADHHFADIKFEVINADKMTEGEAHAFVKHYFEKLADVHLSNR